MLWAVVAVLAVLLCGAAVLLTRTVLAGRRDFAPLPDSFRCRVRLLYGAAPGIRQTWQRRPVRAVWVHDVMLVRTGRLVRVTRVLPVHSTDGSVARAPSTEVPDFGPDPVILGLRLDGGDLVEVAAPRDELERLVGPFVVAAIAADSERTDPRC